MEEVISGEDAENIVGALANALVAQRAGAFRGAMQRGGRPAVTRPQFNAAQLATQVGGTKDAALLAPLGMGSFVFGPATGTTHVFLVEPQEAFRVARIVVSTKYSDADMATQVGFQPLTIGTMPQSPSVEFDIPAEMFQADATDANVDCQICPAGTKIQFRCNLTGAAIPEGETIVVTVGLKGTWIRG